MGETRMINDKAKEFFMFHVKHPDIYKLFVKIAHEKHRDGYKRYAAKAIFEEIRWQYNMKSICESLSNEFTPYYARMFMVQFPDLKGYFKRRPSEADNVYGWEYLMYTFENDKEFMNKLTEKLCEQSYSVKEIADSAKP